MATGRVPTTANSPLTAKGDLFTYSTAPARLAVGNDGETVEHAIIDHGNGEFTSMLKSTYDEQQVEHLTDGLQ
jgi:hypothetical protein